MAAKKSGLGKGLGALFADNSAPDSSVQTLSISEIEPNKSQPRKEFDDEALGDLAQSISRYGVLQPILVRPLLSGGYQIVAGERRWRASRLAGITEVPVVIKELSEQETLQIALVENLQREDLNPIEESLGYKELADQFDMTQEEIAKQVGKSRSAVANSLRLLSLPSAVIDYLKGGELSAGHARALLSLQDEQTIQHTAEQIISKSMSVRETEKLVKSLLREHKASVKTTKRRDSYYDEMELALEEILGRRVKISEKQQGGEITLEYLDKQDLKDIADRLSSGVQ